MLIFILQVILVENKEQSINRALARIDELELKNVTAVVQCNLTGFERVSFDIGVCLHACGVATDLVMDACLKAGASFAICPCCYGAVGDRHSVTYPRSHLFASSQVSAADCVILGRGADQTKAQCSSKASDGLTCMALLDTDRAMRAVERGYRVDIVRMFPADCSPKNHILIGNRLLLDLGCR